MILEVTKRFTFESHHKLPFHDGKCARDHGHSYVLEVSVRGEIKPDEGARDSGMVVDFGDISATIKPLIEGQLDHYSLNAIRSNPTAERMVEWLVGKLTDMPGLCRVRLYETATAWVEWRA